MFRLSNLSVQHIESVSSQKKNIKKGKRIDENFS